MTRTTAALLALGVTVVAVGLMGCATPSDPGTDSPAASSNAGTSPAGPERIAFTRWATLGVGHPQLWTGNADGSDLQPVGDQTGYFPDWSPDRTHLLFDFFDGAGIGQIATIAPDGSGFTQLTDGKSNSEAADYSPDGSTIAFDAYDVPESDPAFAIRLMVMDADGQNARALLDPSEAGFDYEPEYSPDGTQLVFIRYDPASDASAVFLVAADGRGVEQLTPFSAYVAHPRWSPDGSTIVYNVEYIEDFDDPRNGIWSIPASGGEPSVLLATDSEVHGFKPDYSPSGDRILFGCLQRADGAEALCTMKADGSGVTRITDSTDYENHPVWD